LNIINKRVKSTHIHLIYNYFAHITGADKIIVGRNIEEAIKEFERNYCLYRRSRSILSPRRETGGHEA